MTAIARSATIRSADDWDPIDLEILWSRLIHVADECWATIWRTAFSTIIGEALDFGVELLDPRGRSLAHAPRSMPVFNLCLPLTVAALLERFPPGTLRPGDVLMTNDPWICAGHLPDIATVTPVFHHGRLVGLVGSIGNACDIGGTRDSSAARELYEEGILIPPVRLLRDGELNREVLEILAANVRLPEAVVGDVHAQLAANQVGASRLTAFLDEYGLPDLESLATAVQGRSEAAMRAAVRVVPDGVYRAETSTDGLDEAYRLPVAITVAGDEITVDYTGAPPQAERGGINCPYNYTAAHTSYALKCLLTPEIPSNAGCFRPFRVVAAEGSILAARPPASVALRVRTGWHIHELIFKALAPVLPQAVQAGSGLAFLLNAGGVDADGRPFNDHLFHGGGQGASSGVDGHSALLFPTSAGNGSVEMFEQRTPLVVDRKELVPDSAGAGQFRGGFGQRIEVRRLPRARQVFLGAFPEGMRAAPPGLAGGQPGRTARLMIDDGDGRPPRQLPSGTLVELTHPGERLIVEVPGGGGWGDPDRRDRERIVQDASDGLVTPEAACSQYRIAGGR